jgi:hypothetical protein
MKHLDVEQPWHVTALLAIFYVALGVIVATLTSNVIVCFAGGVAAVIFGVRLIIWLG